MGESGRGGRDPRPLQLATQTKSLQQLSSTYSGSGIHLLPWAPQSLLGVCRENSSSTGNKFCPVLLRRQGPGGPRGQRATVFPAPWLMRRRARAKNTQWLAPLPTPTRSHREQVQPARLGETPAQSANRLSLTQNVSSSLPCWPSQNSSGADSSLQARSNSWGSSFREKPDSKDLQLPGRWASQPLNAATAA